jgi:osmotically-inducible protein OsmY
LKKRICMAALVASSLLTGCSTIPQRTAEFQHADLNGDGRVVVAEWLRFGGAEASFLAADTARKGYLDEQEFRQALRFNDEATGNGAARRQQVYDQQIAEDVKRALEQSREVNSWNLKVEVFQGEVTLSGPVRTLRQKQAAEQLAAQVTGVTNVFNQLAIRQ